MNDLINNINPVENSNQQVIPENANESTGTMLNKHQTPTSIEGIQPSGIDPSSAAGLVYTIGQLGYDFGTETNKSIWEQRLNGQATDPTVMVAFLKINPHDASELIWTLSQNSVPVYAIKPYGAYASVVYGRIIELYSQQLDGIIERVAVAGLGAGASRLLDGHTVGNILVTTPRNIVGWNTQALATAVLGSSPSQENQTSFENFLQRIYHELRNLGVSDGSRALNYAATNAAQAGAVFTQAFKDGMQLTSVSTNLSPVSRPGTVTYDVNMTFFDPSNRFEKAKKVYRFMVDVSQVTPVGVGQVRSWSVY